MRKPKPKHKKGRYTGPYLWVGVVVALLAALIYCLNTSNPSQVKEGARDVIVREGGKVSDLTQRRIAREVNAKMRASFPDDWNDFGGPFYDEMVEISKIPVTNQLVQAISRAGRCISLELDNPTIDEDGWQHILAGNNIARLRLEGNVFAGDKIAQVATLKSLYTLEIDNAKLTDHDASSIFGKLTQVKELKISNTNLTDESSQEIGSLTQLETLSLRDVETTNEQLNNFRNVKSLETFNFDCTSDFHGQSVLSSDGFRFLENLTNLHGIVITNVPLNDELFEHFKGLVNLKHLILMDVNVAGEKLGLLSRMTNLRVLSLAGNPIHDSALKLFPPMEKVKEIRLFRTKVTTSGIDQLRQIIPKGNIFSDFNNPYY